jgi:aryl-alcohol dehydrogenase-like predicted oxidoreductase
MPTLALGTAQLGMDYGVANRAPRGGANGGLRLLAAAVEAGIRYLDTAAAYGESEALIGRFLREQGEPDGLRIGTKLSRLAPGLSSADLARRVAEAVEQSRTRLGVEVIDDLLLHSADNLREYGEALVAALAVERDRGRIARFGVSVYEPGECAQLLAHDAFNVIQLPFSVLDQELARAGAIARLRDGGWTVFARSALQQGLLTLDPARGEALVPGSGAWLARFREMCIIHAVTPVAAALGFAASRSGADCLVVGAETVSQVHEVAALVQQPVSEELLEALEQVFVGVPVSVRDPRRWPAPG